VSWQEGYERKCISAEEAASLVKSGDRLFIPMGREPANIGYAIAARKEELRGVRVCPAITARDFGWYDPGWEDCFSIEAQYLMPLVQKMMDERRMDFCVADIHCVMAWEKEGDIDVLLLEVSPADRHGYCRFGGSVWSKKMAVDKDQLVLAEVNPNQIRTYGDNFVHISEIDYFVEHVSTGKTVHTGDLFGRTLAGPGSIEKAIAENISTLIKDGDTIQLGGGGSIEYIPQLGAFGGKQELGIHTEIIPGGLIQLVKKGIFTGARKALHTGKAVGTAMGGSREDYEFVNENPLFELYGAEYVLDPRIIAAHDNMVAINTALAVDLTGQIATDSLGPRMVAGVGGQLAFAIAANLSQGGRYIVGLPSISSHGEPRIVSMFQPGTIVSVPRTLADYIVTEHGIVRLKGKSQRQRAEELISIAHPDLRPELKKEAQRLFWP
jgi:4-hydroxybutyrate CoA-transferase